MLGNRARYSKKQRGIALVLCMILAAIFAAISIYTSEKQQKQLRIFMGLQERVTQKYLAHSLIQRLHYSTLADKEFTWLGEVVELNSFGRPIELSNPEFNDGKIVFSIQDTIGLLSVTNPEIQSFRNVLTEITGDNKKANKIVDEWLDWEDLDSLTRLNGKEKEDFSEPFYFPRNGKVQSLSELMLLDSMDSDTFEQLKPYLTFLNTTGFSPKLSSDELRGLMGLDPIADELRLNAFAKLKNGLYLQQLQSYKVRIDIQGEFSRFQRELVISYRPDDFRLVSISEFGD